MRSSLGGWPDCAPQSRYSTYPLDRPCASIRVVRRISEYRCARPRRLGVRLACGSLDECRGSIRFQSQVPRDHYLHVRDLDFFIRPRLHADGLRRTTGLQPSIGETTPVHHDFTSWSKRYRNALAAKPRISGSLNPNSVEAISYSFVSVVWNIAGSSVLRTIGTPASYSLLTG